MADRLAAVVAHLPRRAWSRGALILVVAACGWARPVGAEHLVRVECMAAAPVEGVLRSIDRDGLVIEVAGGPRRLPLGDVRLVHRVAVAGDASLEPKRYVEVTGVGGLRLIGDDIVWEGTRATLSRGPDRIELPVDRVRRVAWRSAGDDPEWLVAVPMEPASDLVVVTDSEGFQLVECAVDGVTLEAVTVTLDGERIPVKRSKVLGVVTPGANGDGTLVRIAIAGGRFGGSLVAWQDDTLVVDDAFRVPGSLVESIDFAAGRTVALVDLATEKSSSEPTFVAPAAVDGLGGFFAPRIVRPADGPPAWLLRPTSSVTWRIPTGSRRFHARVVAAGGSPSAVVEVVVRPDAAEAWRGRLEGGQSLPLDLDVAASRRLAIEVAVVGEGVGFPVRFDDAAFEK